MKDAIKNAVREEFAQTVAYRRYLHQNPRLSFQEKDTADYICSQLEINGISYRRCGLNGVVARISGQENGPCIAFRADFDALPVQEPEGLTFASINPGVMHACGHDAHTSVLLSMARILNSHREWIRGDVVFIFQDAEELPPGGAGPMIEDGCLEGVDRIYGMHVCDALEEGTVGICQGKYMAASDHFILEFTGKGGHGSRPYETQDTVSAAASAILQINTIVSRFIPPQHSAIISICNVHGGHAYNVVPGLVRVEGSIRTYEDETRQIIKKHIRSMTESCANMYGTGWNFEYEYGYPPVVNSERESELVMAAAKAMDLPLTVLEPTPISEDFSRYLEKIPGAFFRLGIRNEELGAVYPLHNCNFAIDEKALASALECFLAVYLKEIEKI